MCIVLYISFHNISSTQDGTCRSILFFEWKHQQRNSNRVGKKSCSRSSQSLHIRACHNNCHTCQVPSACRPSTSHNDSFEPSAVKKSSQKIAFDSSRISNTLRYSKSHLSPRLMHQAKACTALRQVPIARNCWTARQLALFIPLVSIVKGESSFRLVSNLIHSRVC